ncbi:toll/interleukin-1 receptor domain-containing protein [Ferirhizobium litorale]|uniref:Toll/interleukin-1 receptor domain-containing protein n=1 Tax=Ferirhizobium litorale TaxID=2927786 RepID=A0AAE3U677_9HYPH|nr:toll/interleukin-1 receptor domain-containing protein [Fererhizobium litorale]MDI7925228.1 toll/interleukin-1 receptor domain-containing protein [Fererhizobium litorale]
MAFSQSDIRTSASYTTVRKSASEGRREGKRTAFLCHSHLDADLAKGLQGYLHRKGWEVYIDWEDHTMPERPERRTAEKIQAKIRDLEMFFFLATQNSMVSRWCPWEIGYADGVKDLSRILVVPTRDGRGVTHGNEYLQLYRHLDDTQSGGIGSFDAGGKGYRLSGSQAPT